MLNSCTDFYHKHNAMNCYFSYCLGWLAVLVDKFLMKLCSADYPCEKYCTSGNRYDFDVVTIGRMR